MIWDGYNEKATLSGGRAVLFRPMIAESRAEMRNLMRDFPDARGVAFLERLAWGRLIHPDIRSIGPLLMSDCRILLGQTSADRQAEDVENLRVGLRLALEFPALDKTSCESCRHWWYDPVDQKTAKRDGKKLKRPPESEVLCQIGLCPAGHYDAPRRLSAKNRMAFFHWQGCEAAGVFPDDEIVRRNARVIREVVDGHERMVGRRPGLVRAGSAGRAGGAPGVAAGRGGDASRSLVQLGIPGTG